MPRDDMDADNGPLLPSIMDRLVQSPGTPGLRGGNPNDPKTGIRQDLEKMLNTRWRCVGAPADLKELDVSLVNYGLPDCTASGAGVGLGREDFRRTIERAIQKFEPRFRTVKVKLMNNTETLDRMLRFRIDAVLHGTAEPVVFDTSLETSTATIQVRKPAR